MSFSIPVEFSWRVCKRYGVIIFSRFQFLRKGSGWVKGMELNLVVFWYGRVSVTSKLNVQDKNKVLGEKETDF